MVFYYAVVYILFQYSATSVNYTDVHTLSLHDSLPISLDGANIEIAEAVGADNIFIFGLTAAEVAARRDAGHDAAACIAAEPRLAEVLVQIATGAFRSEEHTSELQSLMRISYAVFCLKKKKTCTHTSENITH